MKNIKPGEIKIIYLLNSGFLVATPHQVIIFDCFADPSSAIVKTIHELKEDDGEDLPVYFIASHAHMDHFNDEIFRCTCCPHAHYILSYDIRKTASGYIHLPRRSNVTFIDEYDFFNDEFIGIEAFSSTDVGVSFGVTLKKDGCSIFHAGDFNWWLWKEDTLENRREAEEAFFDQLRAFKNKAYDIVFFPVDGRLEETAELGAREFIGTAEVSNLIAMHRVGYPRWTPPRNFFQKARRSVIPTWAPVEPGESCYYRDGKLDVQC